MSLSGLKLNAEALEGLSEEERQGIAGDLAFLEDAVKANPLLGYVPHGRQREFHAPPFPRLRAFFGGNRSGKTTAAIVDSIIQCVDAEMVPDHLKPYKRWEPPFKCRVMTPDLTGTMDGAVHEKLRDWCPGSQLKGGSFDKAFDKVLRKLWFKNGSFIQFNSSEQDREKLGGVALHRIVYDEEPREAARNECRVRLADYNGEEIFALTPFSGMKWLYDKLYRPWELGRLDPAKARVVVVDMDDNPHLSQEGKEAALEDYTGPEREARKSGRFVSFAGLIYPMFSPETHVVPMLGRVPPGTEVFRAIDPGYRHMCAVVYCYLDDQNELVVFDEIAAKAWTVKQVCDEMARRDLFWGVPGSGGHTQPLMPNWTVIDPASRNRNNQTGRSDQQEFADNGVVTIPGQNDVKPGINRVTERLNANKLKIAANCTELIEEFRRYHWIQDTGRGEHEVAEAPAKRHDHLLDALRYVVMARPLAPDRDKPVAGESFQKRMLKQSLKQFSRRGRQAPDMGAGPGQWS